MPRRIPDYPDAFAGWNLISSMGSLISVGASLVFLYIVYDLFTNDSQNTNNIISNNYDYSNSDINTSYTNKNTWATLPYFVSGEVFNLNAPSANTIEYAVISPVPTHVFNNNPILPESTKH